MNQRLKKAAAVFITTWAITLCIGAFLLVDLVVGRGIWTLAHSLAFGGSLLGLAALFGLTHVLETERDKLREDEG